MVVTSVAFPGPAQDAEPPSAEEPDSPPVEEADVMTTTTNSVAAQPDTEPTAPPEQLLKVIPGFKMEIVAENPLVESPSAIAFDEAGRLYVAEMRDYPSNDESADLAGRIQLLEDTDGDGVFDTGTTFASNLPLPSAIACANGGVCVLSAPDILFLKDLDGDRRADVRRVEMTGFGPTREAIDPNVLPRGFALGPGFRLHGTMAGLEGAVRPGTRLEAPGLPLKQREFSFITSPATLWPEADGGARGVSFDNAGRRYTASTLVPLGVERIPTSALLRNPFAAPQPQFTDLLTAHSQNRTPSRPPIAGWNPGNVNLLPLSCLIYRGHRFPRSFLDDAFFASPESRAIHHLPMEGGKPRAGSAQPFVVGNDPRFRPMHLAPGPDGVIYIADLCEENYPSSGKVPSRDAERGRIWRLSPATYEKQPVVIPSKAPVPTLVAMLGHKDAWMRETASRVLVERHQTNAVALLTQVAKKARSPLARMHAVRTLGAMGLLKDGELAVALKDQDPRVRIEGLRQVQRRSTQNGLPQGIWLQLTPLVRDSSSEVRLHLALTLAGINHSQKTFALARLFLMDQYDPWIARALLTVPINAATDLFFDMIAEPRIRESDPGFRLLQHLATAIGTGAPLQDVSDCLIKVRDLDPPLTIAYPLVRALADGLAGRGYTLAEADQSGAWRTFAVGSLDYAGAVGTQPDARREAWRLLAACVGPDYIADVVPLALLAPAAGFDVQSGAIEVLARQGLPRDLEALTQRHHLFERRQQKEIVDALLSRENSTRTLVSAVQSGVIAANTLTPLQTTLLLNHPDASNRRRAGAVLSEPELKRDELISDLLPVLDLPGSAVRGRAIYQNRCTSCHSANSLDQSIGPKLGGGRQSRLQILASVLAPSREIRQGWETSVVHLQNEENLWGILDSSREPIFFVRQQGGVRPVVGTLIQSITQLNVSLMPDDVADGLTRQDLADLIAHVAQMD